jgi:hypothetical protein
VRRPFLILLLLTTMGLAACGAPWSNEDPIKAAHRAVAGAGPALHRAGTATVRFDVSLSSQTGYSSADWQGQSRHVYGARPAAATDFDLFRVVTPNPSLRPFTSATNTAHLDLREIAVGDVRYHRSGFLRVPADRPWVSVPANASLLYGSEIADPDLGLLDPDLYLRVTGALTDVAAYTGDTGRRETVGGAATRYYNLTCDLAHSDPAVSTLGDRLARLFPRTPSVRIELWLDDRGRPRKIAATGDLLPASGADPAAGLPSATAAYYLKATLTLSDLGRPVTVDPPPAAQVTPDPYAPPAARAP